MWLVGILLSGATIVGGHLIDRGGLVDISSLTAGLVVLGGTLGAILAGTPYSDLVLAIRIFRSLLPAPVDMRRSIARDIPALANVIRREGLRAAERRIEALTDPFLRHALLLVVEGVPADEIRNQLEDAIYDEEENYEASARVFEQAAGYAPTIGIVGAILGLIRVMHRFGDLGSVGPGIASAFISTLYGVALANVVLLPLACRIRNRGRSEILARKVVLDGITGIAEGLSLSLIRNRMEQYLQPRQAPDAKGLSDAPQSACKAA